jgi:hypothetical protein
MPFSLPSKSPSKSPPDATDHSPDATEDQSPDATKGRSPGATDVTNNQSSGATDNQPPSALTFDQFTPELLEQLREYMQEAFWPSDGSSSPGIETGTNQPHRKPTVGNLKDPKSYDEPPGEHEEASARERPRRQTIRKSVSRDEPTPPRGEDVSPVGPPKTRSSVATSNPTTAQAEKHCMELIKSFGSSVSEVIPGGKHMGAFVQFLSLNSYVGYHEEATQLIATYKSILQDSTSPTGKINKTYMKKKLEKNFSPIYARLVKKYTAELLFPPLVYPQSLVDSSAFARRTNSNFQFGPIPEVPINFKGYLYSFEVSLPGLDSPDFYFVGFVTFEHKSEHDRYLRACDDLYKKYWVAYCGITEDLSFAESLMVHYSPFYLKFVETFKEFRVPPWMVYLQQQADPYQGLPVNVLHESLPTTQGAYRGVTEPATKKRKYRQS